MVPDKRKPHLPSAVPPPQMDRMHIVPSLRNPRVERSGRFPRLARLSMLPRCPAHIFYAACGQSGLCGGDMRGGISLGHNIADHELGPRFMGDLGQRLRVYVVPHICIAWAGGRGRPSRQDPMSPIHTDTFTDLARISVETFEWSTLEEGPPGNCPAAGHAERKMYLPIPQPPPQKQAPSPPSIPDTAPCSEL
jgi:hypothetical protein